MSLVYLRENGLEGIGRFYSTYRGIVINNEDPLKLNRLQIEVPDITQTLVWAYPKGQPGPLQSGAKYLTPEINDVVFVEFQSGDPNYPLWSYCGWAKTQVPPELEKKEVIGIVTPNGNKIFLDDKTNTTKILLKVSEDIGSALTKSVWAGLKSRISGHVRPVIIPPIILSLFLMRSSSTPSLWRRLTYRQPAQLYRKIM